MHLHQTGGLPSKGSHQECAETTSGRKRGSTTVRLAVLKNFKLIIKKGEKLMDSPHTQSFLKRRHTKGNQVCEKCPNGIDHQENSSQKLKERHPELSQHGYCQRDRINKLWWGRQGEQQILHTLIGVCYGAIMTENTMGAPPVIRTPNAVSIFQGKGTPDIPSWRHYSPENIHVILCPI